MRTCLLLTLAILAMSAARAVGQTPAHVVVRPADIVWGPAPPVLEPGAEAAVLAGNPAQPGLLTIRVRVPDKYRIAPHRHSVDEYVTVLSGMLCLAIGEPIVAGRGSCVGAGGFVVIPASVAHAVWTSGATEYQIQTAGPFDMTYLNAADDPSQRRR